MCACCCAAATVAPLGAGPRRDSDGQQICELCPTRITRGGTHRPHGVGRAHKACITRQQRATAPAATAPPLPPPLTPPLTPIQRAKRPYDTLGPTQQWKRKREARNNLQA